MVRAAAAVLLVALTPLAALAQQQEITTQSPDGARIAKAKDRIINIADARTNKLLIRIQAHKKDITALRYAPDGKILVSADGDGKINFYDAAVGKILRTIKANQGVNVLEFSADGKTLEAKAPGGARKFDLATGKEVR